MGTASQCRLAGTIDHGHRLGIALSGGTIKEHDWNVRRIRRLNHGNASARVFWHENDAVHFACNEILYLFELAICVVVGHGLDHFEPAPGALAFDGFVASDPILRLQRFKGDTDGQWLFAGASAFRATRRFVSATAQEQGGHPGEKQLNRFHGRGSENKGFRYERLCPAHSASLVIVASSVGSGGVHSSSTAVWQRLKCAKLFITDGTSRKP